MQFAGEQFEVDFVAVIDAGTFSTVEEGHFMGIRKKRKW